MDDRLLALSDDLLRRILHFVPFKKAASTSVLLRRWGSLWRSSGAVNLAVRVHESKKRGRRPKTMPSSPTATPSSALDAAEAPVKRLTLRVGTGKSHDNIDHFLRRDRDWRIKSDMVGTVLSHRAARRVEQLRIALVEADDARDFSDKEIDRGMRIYDVVSLPASGTLRVLDLTRCDLALSSLGAASFPRLTTLWLRLCSIQPMDLQALLDAAPELATVHLDCVLFTRHLKLSAMKLLRSTGCYVPLRVAKRGGGFPWGWLPAEGPRGDFPR
uniref:F-box/LRR-repeat protein 15/At3g58940/PEG3-like LRR domain-containing protein n=1 Tax=Leersia perrieri TaxID=77586 RepID=A0A0D9XDZ2_9ORYZ